jgi:hypothetical protein
MPNPVFPASAVIHGKASPNFNYLFDGEMDAWRPLNPEDFVGGGMSSSGYRNSDLKGEPSLVNDRASRLAGFLVDSDFDTDPLFVQFYSQHTGVPILTYPLYAYSSIDQNFSSPIGGFQGILIGITTDRDGELPWNGVGGQGILANVYYKY